MASLLNTTTSLEDRLSALEATNAQWQAQWQATNALQVSELQATTAQLQATTAQLQKQISELQASTAQLQKQVSQLTTARQYLGNFSMTELFCLTFRCATVIMMF